MRKHAMILALVMALIMGLVCIGCPGSLGTVDATGASNIANFNAGDGEPEFLLSEILAELGEGTVVAADLEDTMLALAGDPTVTIAVEGGGYVIRFTTGANWGQGLDVNYPGDDTNGFEFEEGDTIIVTGKALNFAASDNGGASWATPALFLKVPAGADNPKVSADDLSANAPFELKYKLTSGDILAIKEGTPPAIRVGGRAIGVSFQINELIVAR
jgi:hypothetical protein